MPGYYPVFLDVRGRRCVVIGGGEMGEEKATRLLEYDADVTVISPDLTEGLRGLADDGAISWTQRGYEPGDLEGAFIAIVSDTSDDSVNRQAYDEARSRNVPLNVVDVPDLCTWIAPAVARQGDVILAASTGGASPALARRLREELEGTSRMQSAHGVMTLADLAPLLAEARKRLSERGVRVNPDHWQACLTDKLVDLVQVGQESRAMEVLMSSLDIGTDCDCENGTCRMWEELGAAQVRA